MAAKNTREAPSGDGLFLPPLLSTCDTWEKAEQLAREALGFILSDPHTSSADRVKAAALILERVKGDLGSAAAAAGSFEVWLAAVQGESQL